MVGVVYRCHTPQSDGEVETCGESEGADECLHEGRSL